MSIFRLLVAWLLMAALPLQGLAAATMLHCDQAIAAVAAAAHEDHGAHADHGHHQAEAPDGHAADHADAATASDADHKCPICALCQVMAVPQSTPILPWADPPSAELPQPCVPALTRAPPRPDKPPRA